MYPRPRSRKAHIDTPNLEELAEDVKHIRFVWGEPLAVVVGLREWQKAKRTLAFREHVAFWPGGEETFEGVPVVVRRTLGAPKVLHTQDQMEEVLLEDHHGC